MLRAAPSGRICRALSLTILIAAGSGLSISAQSLTPTPQPTPQPSPTPSETPSLEKQFFRNIAKDQVAIWTSPFHLKRDDAKWAVPFVVVTGALITTDPRSAEELVENGEHQHRINVSQDISKLGAAYTTGGTAAAFYLVGRATHNYKARETGVLGAEALINSGIVVSVLKAATQRPRPTSADPKDDFFDGGNAFPSGHAISSWALAAVIAHEYQDHKVVPWIAYGVATAVSISRYTGRSHYLSDVFVGSVMGYGIGTYVYKKHHMSPVIDPASPDKTTGKTSGKWYPAISPIYSGKDRLYGVALNWRN
jgi:membrane-associated phospholipid phosphatase